MAAKIVLTRTITAEEIFQLIDRHTVTHFGGAPIVLGMLVNAPDEQRPDLSDRTVRAMTAGAPPPASILEKLSLWGLRLCRSMG